MKIESKSTSIFNVVNYPIMIDGKACNFKHVKDTLYSICCDNMQLSYKRMRDFPCNIGLKQLMQDIKLKDMTVLEIGVYAGEGTQIILDSRKVKKIYCVDPWKPTEKFQLPESLFDYYIGKDNRVVKVKGTIDDFIALYNDKIDMIYIDGGHSYENTKYVIQTTLSKIKPSIITGHDYIKKFSGVIKAIDEFIGKPDKIYCDGSYKKLLNKVICI